MKVICITFIEAYIIDICCRCALSWFSNEPEWYDCNVEGFSQEEAQAITVFAQHLSSDHPASVILGDRFSKSSIQEGESPSIINLCSQVSWGAVSSGKKIHCTSKF